MEFEVGSFLYEKLEILTRYEDESVLRRTEATEVWTTYGRCSDLITRGHGRLKLAFEGSGTLRRVLMPVASSME